MDLASTEAYMVTNGVLSTDVLKNCYVGNKAVTYRIDEGEMVNSDKCTYLVKIDINAQQCYLTSDGKYFIRDIPISYCGARYYDIDETNHRTLT
ncbi:hypothetical protein PIROE2DRAFT_15787 [Piromyces sp. E2]|nr:hypothetical protein PIROE2DRAFT_15787 [Piromyces sp. E2]|eukprot:OUM58858.1 hypothetical protein PIROE2DRAFT_15787 [Piromyces sp. E2]